jgi:hypothetical protein
MSAMGGKRTLVAGMSPPLQHEKVGGRHGQHCKTNGINQDCHRPPEAILGHLPMTQKANQATNPSDYQALPICHRSAPESGCHRTSMHIQMNVRNGSKAARQLRVESGQLKRYDGRDERTFTTAALSGVSPATSVVVQTQVSLRRCGLCHFYCRCQRSGGDFAVDGQSARRVARARRSHFLVVHSVAFRLAPVLMVCRGSAFGGRFLSVAREGERFERAICRDPPLAALSGMGGKRTLGRSGRWPRQRRNLRFVRRYQRRDRCLCRPLSSTRSVGND